jgi:hypothetical protein
MKSNLTLAAIIALAFFWQSSCGKTDNANSTAPRNTTTVNGNTVMSNTNSTAVNTNAKPANANSNVKVINTNSNIGTTNHNSTGATTPNSQTNSNTPPNKKKKIPFYGELGNDAQRAPDTNDQPAPKGSTPGVVNPSGTPTTKPPPRPE